MRIMKTRIREIRRAKGLTLQELAEKIRPEPTTAQTIGRLETGARKTTLDWLVKIADALEVHPSELVDFGGEDEIPVMGLLTQGGHVAPAGAESLHLTAPARHPVAIKVAHPFGDFEVGDTLVCETARGPDLDDCVGRDCLATTAEGDRVFGRLIKGRGTDRYTVVPLGDEGEVVYDAALKWAARPVMLLRYY
jgi:transcriptional regulator with XRE-family HTH domain